MTQKKATPAKKATPRKSTTKKDETLKIEMVPINELMDHPRNYRTHPDDQLEHIKQSLQDNGFYRNVVIAKDGTILAGHGVRMAARHLGIEEIPVIRLDIEPDSPAALKILTGDNEIANLGERDDRMLTEMLKEINMAESNVNGLLGTGFDEMMLANLVFVTRPASEVADFDEAAHWAGMPDYEEAEEAIKITVSFDSLEDRANFAEVLGLALTEKTKSVWWPPRSRDDVASVRFESQ
jgi:hypothetical protein